MGKVYGFFHPYCNAGGGGERVLWQAVKNTLQLEKTNKIVVYTGDLDVSKQEILNNVIKRFNIDLDSKRVDFIYLHHRKYVDPSTWPVLTLLGQAFGSLILTYEAISKFKPDVWIDTMGYPFAYPLVSIWLGIPILAYVHFPVISKDMLNKLKISITSIYGFKQLIKYIYWRSFILLYIIVGHLVDITLTNSTWTFNHINSIWKFNKDISILYPPCSTEKFISEKDLNSEKWDRNNQILVLAQFRPEKRHTLIIEEYSKFLKISKNTSNPKLILIGSIRDQKDKDYVSDLKSKAQSLQIPESQIEFILDAKYELVKTYLYTSSYGLNAMWNEHFGIAVVEYVATGLIPIVHASAGPFYDIVVPWDSKSKKQIDDSDDLTKTGFFFKDKSDPDYNQTKHQVKEFDSLSQVFLKVSKLTDAEKLDITNRGKECVLHKFSDDKFDFEWNESIKRLNSIQKSNKLTIFVSMTIFVLVSILVQQLITKI